MKRLCAAVIILLAAGCNYNHVKQAAETDDGLSAASADANPDYNMIKANVFVPRCLSCHSTSGGNQGGTNLEDYPQVRKLLNRITYRALEKKDMPPRGGLSGGAAQLLQNWVDTGAPESVIVTGEKPDPTLSVGPDDWKKVRDKIFARKCSGCHGVDNPMAELDVTDLKAVRGKAPAIFDRVIVKADMPVAPYPAMTPKERKVLLSWFNAGMPE